MTTVTHHPTRTTGNRPAVAGLVLGILAVLAHLLLPAGWPAVSALSLAAFVTGMVGRRRAQEGAGGGELAGCAVSLAVLAFALGYLT